MKGQILRQYKSGYRIAYIKEQDTVVCLLDLASVKN